MRRRTPPERHRGSRRSQRAQAAHRGDSRSPRQPPPPRQSAGVGEQTDAPPRAAFLCARTGSPGPEPRTPTRGSRTGRQVRCGHSSQYPQSRSRFASSQCLYMASQQFDLIEQAHVAIQAGLALAHSDDLRQTRGLTSGRAARADLRSAAPITCEQPDSPAQVRRVAPTPVQERLARSRRCLSMRPGLEGLRRSNRRSRLPHETRTRSY